MNENFKWIAGAVAVVGLSLYGIIYLSRNDEPAPAETPVVAAPAPAPVPEEPAVKHPLAQPELKDPLPSLNESDAPVYDSFTELLGKEFMERSVVPGQIIRHIVVTVDNLPNEKVAERLRPVRPTPGTFAVAGTEDAPVLDPANYERYQPVLQLVRSTDVQQIATLYTRYYPLFQDAYESLGHPPEYFNDRVIEVIDHLLETPDVQGQIELKQPNVLYEFADPKLESRSAGQKALIRMGSANAAVVKEKLRELRKELVAQPPAN